MEEDNNLQEPETTDVETRYKEFLKKEIAEYCNEEGRYEISWQYDDDLSPKTVLKAIETAVEEGSSIEAVLSDEILEMNMDYDSYFYDTVTDDLDKEDEELENYASNRDLWDDLYENGYNGLDANIDELLEKTELLVNILFATPEEANSDMSNLVSAYGSWQSPEYDMLEDVIDNSLTYLIHQQGHSIKEYYDCLAKNPGGFGLDHKSTFIESCVDDCVNNSSDAMSVIVALTRLNAQETYNLFKLQKEGNGYLEFSTDTTCGTFNAWSGSGGLSIELEKPLIMPVAYIDRIQVEGADNGDYTVDEVFGLTGECWNGQMTVTGETPDLYEEDLSEVVAEIVAEYGDKEEDEEVEESKKITEDTDDLQQIVTDCKKAYKENDLKTAYEKWSELNDKVSDINELDNYMKQFSDKEVYAITDFGKRQSYRKMGYDY